MKRKMFVRVLSLSVRIGEKSERPGFQGYAKAVYASVLGSVWCERFTSETET